MERAAVGLGTLRKVAKSKVQYVPTLGTVIPYLELSAKQEYLVQRIKGNQNAWCALRFILLNGVPNFNYSFNKKSAAYQLGV